MTSQLLRPRHPFHFDRQTYRNHYPDTDSFAAADPAALSNGTPLLDNTEQSILDDFLRNPDAFNHDGTVLNRGPHPGQAAANANFNFLMTEATPELHDVSLFGIDLQTPTQPNMSHFGSPTTSSFNSMDILSQASALSHGIVVPPQHQARDAPANMVTTSAAYATAYPTAMPHSFVPPAPTAMRAPQAPATMTPASRAHQQQRPLAGQRRQTDDHFIFNMKPFDGRPDVKLAPVTTNGFEDEHVGMPLAPRSATTADRPHSYLHSRHHSESFLMTTAGSSIHYSDADTADAADDEDANKRLYRFGSDTAHFAPTGFIRGEGDPSTEDLTRRMLNGNFGAIGGGHISPSETRVASPSVESRRRKRDEEAYYSDDEPDSQRPKMEYAPARRASTAAGVRQRTASISEVPNHQRRKSSPLGGAAAARRPPRENLTDEQKRNNHILSEQRRRNIIKKGFDYVNSIVPGLREGGYSKSNVLTEATDYLHKLVSGNADLERALGFM